ncbi:succinate dehydrogenase assembly factor 2 [Henriciella mobilis]|uniref:FAD assembly factor SdhE n=3 Tax=Henriciella mobilis TaxID=2305467 RepID=A0A399RCM2_9PROT|nr:succinate dehydrogenase assembly factor 2 [Henriciella mobilis]RIJ18819.1 succinate dehydrogenase assembly factor 2 [Henriciella mobilis]RIJ28191.1 succinate dehydrogenase assembly factor 2 [Henriciella mobilis]
MKVMDERRRKLNFRAWRRGFREMDLIMGQFADQHIGAMSENELQEFERLLATPDWEVYAWIVGNKPVPPNYAGPVLDRLLSFEYDPRA